MRVDSWVLCAFVLVGCWGDTPSGEDREGGPSPLVSSSPLDEVSGSCAEGTEREVARQAIDERHELAFRILVLERRRRA